MEQKIEVQEKLGYIRTQTKLIIIERRPRSVHRLISAN